MAVGRGDDDEPEVHGGLLLDCSRCPHHSRRTSTVVARHPARGVGRHRRSRSGLAIWHGASPAPRLSGWGHRGFRPTPGRGRCRVAPSQLAGGAGRGCRSTFADGITRDARMNLGRTNNLPLATPGGCERCRRRQRPLTQAARDRETTESFRRVRAGDATPGRPGRSARLAESEPLRLDAAWQIVARTGDRMQKGRRRETPAFRITRR